MGRVWNIQYMCLFSHSSNRTTTFYNVHCTSSLWFFHIYLSKSLNWLSLPWFDIIFINPWFFHWIYSTSPLRFSYLGEDQNSNLWTKTVSIDCTLNYSACNINDGQFLWNIISSIKLNVIKFMLSIWSAHNAFHKKLYRNESRIRKYFLDFAFCASIKKQNVALKLCSIF